ncbi:MAG TPA: glycosyltransferase [Candidatus Paceibacterota bacterium]|nr:glycosyltransferase [Candidatus Paceibacterota bacterium]
MIKKNKQNNKGKISIIIPLAVGKKLDYSNKNNNLKIIIKEGDNPSKNRNSGVKETKTELIAFTNGHTYIPDNWYENVTNFFRENPQVDIVGGPQLTPKNSSLFERASGYALGSIFGAGGVKSRYSGKKLFLNADETMLTSANLVCKKKVFEKIKFDESLYPGEDPKFINDAKKEGFIVAYSPNIVVHNKRRTTIDELSKQIFGYGKTRPEKENFFETLKKPFFIIPSLFLFYLIILLIYITYKLLNNQTVNLFFVLPLIIYVLLNLIFSLVNSIKNKDFLAIFLLPEIYFVIHVSYGLGFITSTLKKQRRS